MKRIIVSAFNYHNLSNIYSSTNLDPDSCIDITSTGMSYYDDFLDPKSLHYLESKKNLTGHIEYMTPLKYYQECAIIFNSSVDSLKSQRNRDHDSIDWLTNEINSGNKFKLPTINYTNAGQEGLHRMMVLANVFGWDTEKFPVLIVNYVDERVAIVQEAYHELNKAIRNSIDYTYTEDTLPDYLISQIQFELDKRGVDDVSEYEAKCIEELSDRYIISITGFESEIKIAVWKDDIQIRDPEDEITDIDNLDWDDLDLDDMDIEDLLISLKN